MNIRWQVQQAKYGLIYMLGGLPLTHRKVQEWKAEQYYKAVDHVRSTLEASDKVYVEPVTVNGDGLHLGNCTFFGSHDGGTALTINPLTGEPGVIVSGTMFLG